MKIYFDNVENLFEPNCKQLSTNGNSDYWLTASGSRLKEELKILKVNFYKLSEIDSPGLYFIAVNGDPIWWCGLAPGENVPSIHILKCLPKHIIDLVKNKKIRIVISADREGGGMIFNDLDCFAATTNAMLELNLPANSVLIIQGNLKIEEQYNNWLLKTQNKKLFDVKYSNHFDKIFIENFKLPKSPIIYESLKNPNVKDFNSLNRTYKVHRSAHLYILAITNLLEKGIVSANELKLKNLEPLELMKIVNEQTDDMVKYQLLKDFDSILSLNYPKYIDGDWSVINAANSVNEEIFKNSLVSFVTETKFNEDVIFLTEKVFKCLTYGHPMIVLASCGTLRTLEKMGYNIYFGGIDPNYNDIENDTERFFATHRALQIWINLSFEEKIKRIKESLPAIIHNFQLSRSRNFYHESLTATINSSKEYFND